MSIKLFFNKKKTTDGYREFTLNIQNELDLE